MQYTEHKKFESVNCCIFYFQGDGNPIPLYSAPCKGGPLNWGSGVEKGIVVILKLMNKLSLSLSLSILSASNYFQTLATKTVEHI